MSESNSIINLGDLSKPATVLIEKISDAIGGIFKPYQIRRVAEAEAQAEKTKALVQIKINELQQRAINRFMIEEAYKQNNIENITQKALPLLEMTTSRPENIERDWIVNFFDKSKLISDEEMQDLWAKILAGEANAPGSFSKRTIHLVAELDKDDAILFDKLCSFIWTIDNLVPLILDTDADIYKKGGIYFSTLKHLDSIGLISLESLSGYKRTGFEKKATIFYQGNPLVIEFPNEKDNELKIGHALFTQAGRELAHICNPLKIDGFIDYAIQYWIKMGLKFKDFPTAMDQPSTQTNSK